MLNQDLINLIEALTPIVTAIIGVIGGKKISDMNKSRTNLIDHPIFSRIEYNKIVISNHFKLENKGKEKVFKEILTKHLEIYEKYIKEFCNYIDSNKVVDVTHLSNISIKTLNSIINDLCDFYKLDGSYTADEIKVFNIVMQKYNHWNHSREEEIFRRVNEITGSLFYPDTYSKALAILDTYLWVVNDTIADASVTLSKINGDLKGLVFKGVKI